MPHRNAWICAALIVAWLPTDASAGMSMFRLLGGRLEGDQVALDVCITHQHTDGTVVDFFAHKGPARHYNTQAPEFPLIREGLAVASFKDLKHNETRNVTIRVPLADLQKQGLDVGGTLYLAANWVSQENSGSGHHYGALHQCANDNYASTSCVIQAQQNAAFRRPSALRNSLLRFIATGRPALPLARPNARFGDGGAPRMPWARRGRSPALGRGRGTLGR